MARSDTDVMQDADWSRASTTSTCDPFVDDSILEIKRLKRLDNLQVELLPFNIIMQILSILILFHPNRKRMRRAPGSIMKGLADWSSHATDDNVTDSNENCDTNLQPPYVTLIKQLFVFIGSQPEKAVSVTSSQS